VFDGWRAERSGNETPPITPRRENKTRPGSVRTTRSTAFGTKSRGGKEQQTNPKHSPGNFALIHAARARSLWRTAADKGPGSDNDIDPLSIWRSERSKVDVKMRLGVYALCPSVRRTRSRRRVTDGKRVRTSRNPKEVSNKRSRVCVRVCLFVCLCAWVSGRARAVTDKSYT